MEIQFKIFSYFRLCVITAFMTCISCSKNPKNIDLRIQHVVVIGVDGMSVDGVLNAATPTLDYMMKHGAYTLGARAVLPTSSSTNWASMISGAGPEQHGVTSNEWQRDDHILPPVVEGSEGIFPTIFGVVKKQIPGSKIGAIYNWTGFGRLVEKTYVDFDANPNNEYATTQTAVEYILKERPSFLFIHLDHVDHAGHEYGHKTPHYYQSVTSADSLVSLILAAIEKSGIMDNTLVIVSADHGGIGFGHGGMSLDEIEIPFILYGKGVKKNYNIAHTVYTYDNAATAAFALGCKIPYAWIGKPVKSAFQGFEEPMAGAVKNYLVAPTIFPKARLYDPPGGLFIDKSAKVVMESPIEGAEIRYTLDGSEPANNSTLYTGPFEIHKTTVLAAKLFKGPEVSRTSKAFYRVVRSNSENGVAYEYFENQTWNRLPIFENFVPKSHGVTHEFRSESIIQRKDHFAIRLRSHLEIDKPGSYKFYLYSDDGSKMYINGEVVVDNDGSHGTIEQSGTMDLQVGRHEITVDYLNNGGGGWLDAFYAGPGVSKQIIPANKLFLKKDQ